MSGNAITPIRLVSQNGKFYNLNCTTLTIDVDRSVSASSMPFLNAYRFSMDLNMTNAMITLEGYITDDDVLQNSDSANHEALVDFDAVETASGTITSNTFATYIPAILEFYDPNPSTYLNNHAHRLNQKHGLHIEDGNGNRKNIFFGVISAQYATHGGLADSFIVQIHDGTNAKTDAQVAANLKALIDASITGVSATLQIGEKGNADTRVLLTYAGPPTSTQYTDSRGTPSSNDSFVWKNNAIPTPKYTQFTGGKLSSSQSGMSAGDMVQQLYAIIDNSNDEWGDAGKSDYIHAIQIPFLSKVAAESGDKYSSRYFFQTAGNDVEDGNWKGSDVEGLKEGNIFAKNTVAAGTKYKNVYGGRTFTGIKALVDKATFVQVAGEPNIYQFTIIMLPTNTVY
tara:strand:+ start:5539 stop:6732 length:1194 start_codon:yes stop_codon:yes gene_type:complete